MCCRNVLAAVTDISISTILVYYLVRQRPRSIEQVSHLCQLIRGKNAAVILILTNYFQKWPDVRAALSTDHQPLLNMFVRCSDIAEWGSHCRLGGVNYYCICELPILGNRLSP